MPKKSQSQSQLQFEESVYNALPTLTITQFNIHLHNRELTPEMIENSLLLRAVVSNRFDMVVGMIRFLDAKNKGNVVKQLLNQVGQSGFLPITQYLLLKTPLKQYILKHLIQYSNCTLKDSFGNSATGLLLRYHQERFFLNQVFKLLLHSRKTDPLWLSALELLLKSDLQKPEYDYQKFMYELEWNLINNKECHTLYQIFCINFNRKLLMVQGCGILAGKELLELLSYLKINMSAPLKINEPLDMKTLTKLPPVVAPISHPPARETFPQYPSNTKDHKLSKDAKPFEPIRRKTLRDHKSFAVQQTLDFSHIHSLIDDLEADKRLTLSETSSPTLSAVSTSSDTSSEREFTTPFYTLDSLSMWQGSKLFFTEASPLTQQQREEIDSLNLVNLSNSSSKTSSTLSST